MANTLSVLRNRAGYRSQVAVGKILGVDGVTVSRWESGKRTPNVNYIQRLAELYKASEGEIIDAIVSTQEPLNCGEY